MIFHRLEPMFEYPEKWDFPIYIYILYLYFSGFLTFFDDFCPILDFIDFLCTLPRKRVDFCRVVFISLNGTFLIFALSERWDQFLRFLAFFFNRYFFWIVFFFVDRFFIFFFFFCFFFG